MPKLFQVNKAATVSEVFDGETIAINFRNGTYSALSGSGPAIYDMLADPSSVETICAAIATTAKTPPPNLKAEVREFIDGLLSAELIIELGDGDGHAQHRFAGTYTVPVVETFADLAELMLIDPVHEVDVFEGWPKQPPEGK